MATPSARLEPEPNTPRSSVLCGRSEDPLVSAWKAARKQQNGQAARRSADPRSAVRVVIGALLLGVPLVENRAHHPSAAALSFGLLFFAWMISLRPLFGRFGDERNGALLFLAESDAAWARGDKRRSTALTFEAAARARSPELRERAWSLLAERALTIGDPCLAHAALVELPAERIGAALLGAYLAVCNRRQESLDFLEDALAEAALDSAALKLLIDLHYERGNRHRIEQLASAPALSEKDRTAIRVALSR